jgi:hypothetical protein
MGISPKKEIDHKVIEHVFVFLNVVTECNQLSSFLRYLWVWASALHGMYESFLWISNAEQYLE